MHFPHQPEQLTAEWLTGTLRQAGVLHAAQVASFAVKPLSETLGLLGPNTIIRITYDTPEVCAPQSLFAKFALADAGHCANWRTSYVQEVLFYQNFPSGRLCPPHARISASLMTRLATSLSCWKIAVMAKSGSVSLVARLKEQGWLSQRSPNSIPHGGIIPMCHRMAGNIQKRRL